MKNISFSLDNQTRLYLQNTRYSESDNSIKEKILSALENDHRVQSLKGRMISSGSGACGFDIRALSHWFLWASDKYGFDSAESNLHKFLDSEKVTVVNTLWVLGIELDGSIELENGVRIVPILEMLDSQDKERYLRRGFDMSAYIVPKPKAAITYICEVMKSWEDYDFPKILKIDKEFWNSSLLLNNVSLLLNVIDGVSCIPYSSTSYTLPEMPMGIFGGSGSGFPLPDVIGHKSSKLGHGDVIEINDLLKSFNSLSQKNKIRMSRVLSRLAQSKRRDQIEDKILDLGIALEMALLDDNVNNEQLSLTFRLRGSWLIGEDYEQRVIIYNKLKEIYRYRSQVAHSGMLCGNNQDNINAVSETFRDYENLSEKIIRKLIHHENIDWSSLILGTI
jgi:hypothetical protein